MSFMLFHRRNIVGIPLKSATVSADWSSVCFNLKQTVDSALRQDVGNAKCIIAGHERPDFLNDPAYRRVIFLEVPFAPPVDPKGYMWDKQRKKIAIGAYLRKRCWRGFNFMFADADDILHPSLFSVVRPRGRHAIILNAGLVVDASTGQMGVASKFYRICGTSMICRMLRSDLPKSPDDTKSFFSRLNNHTLWMQTCEDHGLRAKTRDFIGVAYITGHGENDHALRNGAIYTKRLIKGAADGDPSAEPFKLGQIFDRYRIANPCKALPPYRTQV